MSSVRLCNPYEPDFLECSGLETPVRWNPYLPGLPGPQVDRAPLFVIPDLPRPDLADRAFVLDVRLEDEWHISASLTEFPATSVPEPAVSLLACIVAAACAVRVRRGRA